MNKKFDENLLNEKLKEYQKNRRIELRNEIVLMALNIVDYVAYPYYNMNRIDCMEIKSYGYEGLILAVENYDFKSGKFVNYACECVRNHIRHGIEKINGYKQTYYWDFLSYRRPIEKEKGEYLEYNPEIIDEIFKELEKNKLITQKKMQTLKNMYFANNHNSIDKALSIPDTIVIEDEIINNLQIEELKKAINILNPREKEIIMYRFGFYDDCYTLRQLEEMYNKTHEGIRFIEKRSLKKLQEYMLNEEKKKSKKRTRF